MKALTTIQLNDVLMKNPVTNKSYIGTFPGCVIPTAKSKRYSFITNTDLHHQRGEHWNAWVVHGEKILFFDSFGRDPRDSTFPEIYKELLNRFNNFKYTKTQVQNFTSSTCGYYCIHFLYVLSLGLDFEFFLNEYTDDFKMNDIAVIDFVNNL
jgi:hypothetical protein